MASSCSRVFCWFNLSPREFFPLISFYSWKVVEVVVSSEFLTIIDSTLHICLQNYLKNGKLYERRRLKDLALFSVSVSLSLQKLIIYDEWSLVHECYSSFFVILFPLPSFLFQMISSVCSNNHSLQRFALNSQEKEDPFKNHSNRREEKQRKKGKYLET